MPVALQLLPVAIGGILWVLGLQLYLRAEYSLRDKFIWTGVLILVGVTIGLLLPAPSIRGKFILLLLTLPIVAAVDLVFLRPARTLSFWLRACGYEVCTVFGVAGLTRLILGAIAIAPILAR
jgi:hypothetical protein